MNKGIIILLQFVVMLKGHCHGLTCASVQSKTWKSEPDVFKLDARIFNMPSTSGLRTRREKEQLGTEKKVWWQRGIQESGVESHKRIYLKERIFFKSARVNASAHVNQWQCPFKQSLIMLLNNSVQTFLFKTSSNFFW